MTLNSRRFNAALLAAYDFEQFRTIVDVGGGTGAFLAGILAAYPNLHGVLFDQAHVISGAPELLKQSGVADRCSVIGGDFFASVPDGADAYVLRAVIHDWDDEESVRILAVVRRAIQSKGTLLLVERVIAPPNQGRDSKFSDLNMLVSPGGRDRTHEEFVTLLEASGFRLTGIVDAGAYSIVEADTV